MFVQASGEIEYGLEIPVEYFKPYTGNFSIVDFTHWPDLKTVESLAFTPPGFILGKIFRFWFLNLMTRGMDLLTGVG